MMPIRARTMWIASNSSLTVLPQHEFRPLVSVRSLDVSRSFRFRFVHKKGTYPYRSLVHNRAVWS